MLKEQDINEIINKYSDMVYRIALTRCGNIQNAEDIFQEVFLKFSQKSPKFQNTEHEKAWFIRVTINLTKNLNNSAWNRKVVNLAENIEFEEKESEEIFTIVSNLPRNYRTVIYLYYYEGYKVKEISKLIKKSEGTVKTWLSRARQNLKHEIEGGFEDE